MAGLWGDDAPRHSRPTTDDTTKQREGKRYTWGVADPKVGKKKGHRKATRTDPSRWRPKS
jgi:hypothetical protein